MNLLIRPLSQKLVAMSAVLLLSACGGGSNTSRDAISATEELQQLADNAVSQPTVVAPVPNPLNPTDPTDIANTNDILVAAGVAAGDIPLAAAGSVNITPGIADVYVGTIDLPYYFDPANSTTSFWLPSLEVRDIFTAPVMMTFPNAGSGQTMPATGWPIVIFQHGITRNRTDVIAYADAQAAAGFAVISIDLPTHGLVDSANPFNASNTAFPNDEEQTFGVNATSGQNFINIPSLLTSRDNVRQGAANLLTLRKSLGSIVNAVTGSVVSIDTTKVGFIAHSLGGIVGTVYLGVETTPTPSSLVTTGATITDVLQSSPAFSPVIGAGLAALGVSTPEDVTAFYDNAQEIIDSGEPLNYASTAASIHPIQLIEVIGDTTVDNSASDILSGAMGASPVNAAITPVAPGTPRIVRFTRGEHGSVATPDSNSNPDPDQDFIDVTREMQTQLATFQATAISPTGPLIIIDNSEIIEGVSPAQE